MMTGKENYTRAIEFKGPAYLPCGVGANLDWLHDKDAGKRQRVRELAARFPHDMLGWVSPKDFGTELGTRDGDHIMPGAHLPMDRRIGHSPEAEA